MTPTAQPVAYVRKSVAGRSDMDRSRDNQTAAIATLAERDGATIARVYDGDWGRSGGRSGRAKRSAMAELIEAVRSGAVAAVYAYSLDRLARDTEYALTLWNACADQGVPIIVDGSRFDTADPADRMRYVITHEMSAGELDRITKRNRDIKARARVTGTSLGGALVYGSDPAHPGEDPAVIVTLYHKIGTFLGTARALTAAGVPTRHGKPWTVRSVAVLIRREGDEIDKAPPRSRQGVSRRSTRLFSGLLTCHCGATLTSMPRPGRKRNDGTTGPGSIAYYCRDAHLDARHPRPYMVSEPKVLAWAKVATAERATTMLHAVHEAGPTISLEAIAAKRAALGDAYSAGAFTLPALQGRLAKLDALVAAATARGRVIGLDLRETWGAASWERPVVAINADLHTIWQEVKLGRDMLPTEAIAWDA